MSTPNQMPRKLDPMSIMPSVRDELDGFDATWGKHIEEVSRIYQAIIDGGIEDEQAAATLTLATVMLSPENEDQ